MTLHSRINFTTSVGVALLAIATLAGIPVALAQVSSPKADAPSRPADRDCKWEKFADANLHLQAWVERCNYNGRKIDFVTVDHSLAIRYSDGGAPDPLVDVFDLQAKETPEQGLRRLFAARTDKALVAKCVLAPYHYEGMDTPAGVERYTFIPDKAYQKALDAKAKAEGDDGDIPEPPCGDWGDTADGIQYFEVQPASGVAKVLFVRVGQDIPLFDEATLRLH